MLEMQNGLRRCGRGALFSGRSAVDQTPTRAAASNVLRSATAGCLRFAPATMARQPRAVVGLAELPGPGGGGQPTEQSEAVCRDGGRRARAGPNDHGEQGPGRRSRHRGTARTGVAPGLTPDQLPSGEQQVLLLFGELTRRRRRGAVLMIDEPEISLHPTLQRQVVHQLRRLTREWDMQVILATHSLEVLRAVHESERILLDQLDTTPRRRPPDESLSSAG